MQLDVIKMSIIQGGSGFPVLHDSIYAYLCTDGLVINTSSLPEETLKFVIQKVKIIWFRLYCDVIVIFRCITRKYSND